MPQAWAQNPIAGSRTIYGALNTGVSAGTATAYLLTLAPPIQSYHVGACYAFLAHVANTGPATLNVNGKGALALTKRIAGVSTPLAANDIGINQRVEACYDGTVLQVQGFSAASSGSGGGVSLGAAGTLQGADGTGLFAAYGGSTCLLAGTYASGFSATGSLICSVPPSPVSTAKPLLVQSNSQFPSGVNLGGLSTGLLLLTTQAGVATPTTIPLPAGSLAGTAGPQTLDQTFVPPRSNTLPDPSTTGGTIQPTPSLYDVESVTAMTASATVLNPLGPARAAQWYRLRLRSVTSQPLAWDTQYSTNAGWMLPTATTGLNKDDLLLFEYEPTTSTWQLIFTSQLIATLGAGGGGSTTAPGVTGDIPFHGDSTALTVDTGQFFYDLGPHSGTIQEMRHGQGSGVVELADGHGFTSTILAANLTDNHLNTMPDADGPLCTAASCGLVVGAVNPQTSTYQVLATDFSDHKTIAVASGTFTITLVASGTQPATGQFIRIVNYGTGVVTVARSGQNINGGTASIVIPASSATAPTTVVVISDGTNYFASLDSVGTGMTNPMTTAGDWIYGGASGTPTRLAAGTGFLYGNGASAPTIAKLARGIVFEIGDPAGSALTVASTTTAYVTIPFACTISAYNLLVDAGTITVKFWRVATGTAIPTSANSINTSGVGIASGTAIHSTTLTDFTSTAIAANDIVAANVTAVATAKYVNATLQCDQ